MNTADAAFLLPRGRAGRCATAGWLATWAFLVPPSAGASPTAQGILHKVTSSRETYDQLADHYYGARYLAHHLSLKNRYREPLKPGVTLIIPTYRRVALGDLSLDSFARRHLSRGSRSAYLEKLHGLTGKPGPNTRLIVPPVVRHRVHARETLRAIARTYYRDASPRRQTLLRLYNELPTSRLRARAILRIPLDLPAFAHERVLARSRRPLRPKANPPSTIAAPADTPTARSTPTPTPAMAAKTRAPSNPATPPQKAERAQKTEHARWANRVETVERLYADGHYRRSLNQATRALSVARPTPRRYRTQLLSLAASSLVALDRSDEAKAHLRELLTLEPGYEPDSYRTSPKVLDVFEAARLDLQRRSAKP